MRRFHLAFARAFFGRLPIVGRLTRLSSLFPRGSVVQEGPTFRRRPFREHAAAWDSVYLTANGRTTYRVRRSATRHGPLTLVRNSHPNGAGQRLLRDASGFFFSLFLLFIMFVFVITPEDQLSRVFPPILWRSMSVPVLISPQRRASHAVSPAAFVVVVSGGGLNLLLSK